MQATRVIFKGKFDFGSPETVGRIARMLEPRILNLYKSDFPWKLEDILPEGSEQLVIKSESLHLSDRTWKHAIDGLEFLAQFALCGEVMAFKLGGSAKAATVVKPNSEKAAVVLFNHAMESNCMIARGDLLDQTLDKYPAHADALVARANIAIAEDRFADADEDLTRALERDPEHSAAWLAWAHCAYRTSQWDEAMERVERVTKNSMPLEEIHWEARYFKAEMLQARGDYADAAKELQAVLTRMETRPKLLASDRKDIQDALSLCTEHLGVEGSNEVAGLARTGRLAKATV